LPSKNAYIQTKNFLSPQTGPAKGPPLTRADFGDKPVSLIIGDSCIGKIRLTKGSRTFQFRYDAEAGESWSVGTGAGPLEPLSSRVYDCNDYLMVDRSELLPDEPDRVEFVMTGSGMCIK
jgi:hypothetical protein